MVLDLDKAYCELQEDINKNFLFYRPYPVFEEFHRLGNEASIRLLLAANRIGKTYSCLAETAMHATTTYPDTWCGFKYKKKNLTVWIGGLTSFEAEDLSLRLFKGTSNDPAFIHPSLVIYANRKDRRYQVLNGNGGVTEIALKTYGGREQQNELSTWKASKVDFILLDEQPTQSVFSECCMRIMNTSPDDRGMIVIAATCTQFTPFVLGFTQRVEKVEVEDSGLKRVEEIQVNIGSGEIKDGKVYLLAGWEDAQHLDDTQKKQMMANMIPAEVDARTKGMPSIGSGMVNPVLQELITCEPFDVPDHFGRIIGMDFGWTDPTALVFGAHDRDKDIIYITHEYAVSEKTPEEHVYLLSRQKGAECFRWANVMYDPSGRISAQKDGEKLVPLYIKAGLKMRKADNAREAGVMRCLQRMRNDQLKIFKSCPRIFREISTYARKEGVIKDGDDHLLDAMRYMVGGVHSNHAKISAQAIHKYQISDLINRPVGGLWDRI